jgi:type IV pilus assembly protein PilO
MKLPKLSPRDELIAELIAVVLVAVALVVLFIMPAINGRADLQKKEATIQQQMQTSEATLARLKEAQRGAIADQAELIRIANQVPDQPEMPTLIVQIQDLANQAGITFVSITPATPVTVGSVDQVTLTLVLKGQFRDVNDFLSRLYTLTRKVRVTNVSLSAEVYPELTVNLTAQTFAMSSKGAGTGAPPAPPSTGGGG